MSERLPTIHSATTIPLGEIPTPTQASGEREQQRSDRRSMDLNRKRLYLSTVLFFASVSAHGQTIDSRLHDMNEALAPYGDVATDTCRNLLIDLKGPWGNFALPDGIDKDSPDQFTWSILKADILRLYVNLTVLDEDKVTNHALFSMEYLSKHQKGKPYVADIPTVMLFTKGLNANVVVHAVDLDKVNALHGQTNVSEEQLGWSMDERKYAVITFQDQQHADAFAKAVQKAIVLCKAQ